MKKDLNWVASLLLGYGALILVALGGVAFVILDSWVSGLHPGLEAALFVIFAGLMTYIGVYFVTVPMSDCAASDRMKTETAVSGVT